MLLVACSTLNTEYFGNQIAWRSLKDGMKEMEESHKPGIVIIFKSWCGACKGLGRRIASDEKTIEFSKRFVMILAMDDEEPEEEKWLPGRRCWRV